MLKKIMVVSALLFFFSVNVQAKEVEKGFNLIVTPEFPDNQRKENKEYFDLKVEPGQKQTIAVRLRNNGTTNKKYKLFANTAKTNGYGGIQYSHNKALLSDVSIPYQFNKLVAMDEIVEVPKKSEKKVSITLDMPKESFDGELAGTIEFIEVEEREKKKDTVKIDYSYEIGIILRETDKKLIPKLDIIDISAGVKDYRESFLVSIANQQAMFLENITTDVTILKDGKIIANHCLTNMRMAPNSVMVYPVFSENLSLSDISLGEYEAKIEVTNQKEINKSWTEKFMVTSGVIEEIRSEVNDAQTRIKYPVILIVFLGILMILAIVFITFCNFKINK